MGKSKFKNIGNRGIGLVMIILLFSMNTNAISSDPLKNGDFEIYQEHTDPDTDVLYATFSDWTVTPETYEISVLAQSKSMGAGESISVPVFANIFQDVNYRYSDFVHLNFYMYGDEDEPHILVLLNEEFMEADQTWHRIPDENAGPHSAHLFEGSKKDRWYSVTLTKSMLYDKGWRDGDILYRIAFYVTPQSLQHVYFDRVTVIEYSGGGGGDPCHNPMFPC